MNHPQRLVLIAGRPLPAQVRQSHKGTAEQQTHALHLTEPGSDLWRERFAFRDALRADPELRAEYQQLKQELAAVHPDNGPAYTAGKRELVARVLATAGIRLGPPRR